jgi:low temperature requirement protein LtrA
MRDLARPTLPLKIFAVALTAILLALPLDQAYGRVRLTFALAYRRRTLNRSMLAR